MANEYEERLCDIAAAELTMPTGIFDEYAKRHSIPELSEIFQVSQLMVAVRLAGGAIPMNFRGDRSCCFKLFNPAEHILRCALDKKPYVLVWVYSTIGLKCRDYQDCHGVPHVFRPRPVPVLFKEFPVFSIPYLVTGYDVPPRLEFSTTVNPVMKLEVKNLQR